MRRWIERFALHGFLPFSQLWSTPAPIWVEYLIVAGGGRGGYSSTGAGVVASGGGGAGALREGSIALERGRTFPVVVGAGAVGGLDEVNRKGGDSSALGVTAEGGGYGGKYGAAGGNGGCGGGAGGDHPTPGLGSVGGDGGIQVVANEGGGGGGMGGDAGGNGFGTDGGPGLVRSIKGAAQTYCEGGNAGALGGVKVTKGSGGLGSNAVGDPGGNGIIGEVVIRYAGNQQRCSGGTVTFIAGYVVHTFSANGNFLT
jgi:hypothetical protein